MIIRKRKGFTLVELIVVVGILGIVSLAIMSVFLAANNIFIESAKLSKEQSETRLAMAQVKKELGVAKNVVIYQIIPATLPTSGGYCYFDTYSQHLQLRLMDGSSHTLFSTQTTNEMTQILFSAVSVNGRFNTVSLDWTVGDYHVATDVYIQNSSTDGGVTTDYDISGTPLPGVYIEFN